MNQNNNFLESLSTRRILYSIYYKISNTFVYRVKLRTQKENNCQLKEQQCNSIEIIRNYLEIHERISTLQIEMFSLSDSF